ncbi:cupin domain-containing protein [Streptomyces sp. N2-109]|uniref:Cupin domain-containing protein n=1 Tax=Streptomyces gossypii TaxID=2883101 RepID=A0ABT2JVS4_9ACTN|nr:cupin domain-containing protein [Streptomyces gossypii]MCT2591998.1 cupin domain-containing protein [Streptomyces gossypii]
MSKELTEPIDLATALTRFEQLWSPRIVGSVNDYDVRVAKVAGEHVWHSHADTDEFFLVLQGELHIALRDGRAGDGRAGDGRAGDGRAGDGRGAERVVVLPKGSLYVVPRGVEHKPSSPEGASILMFEPTGTSTVGDLTDEHVPGHVDATTGHALNS